MGGGVVMGCMGICGRKGIRTDFDSLLEIILICYRYPSAAPRLKQRSAPPSFETSQYPQLPPLSRRPSPHLITKQPCHSSNFQKPTKPNETRPNPSEGNALRLQQRRLTLPTQTHTFPNHHHHRHHDCPTPTNTIAAPSKPN
jgi:hypothetical protein